MELLQRVRTVEDRPLGVAEWIVWSIVAAVLVAISIPVHAVLHGVHLPLAFVLGILQGGSVLLAALVPPAGAAAHAAAIIGIACAADPESGPWPITVVGMVSLAALLVAAGVRSHWLLGLLTLAVTIAAAAVIGSVADLLLGAGSGWVVDLLVAGGNAGLALLVITAITQLRSARREVATARRETEHEHARLLWQQERARIAREMHDVVAHSMSLVHMRATSASYRLASLDDDARDEFARIADDARAAMHEMRGLLRVLRDPDEVLTAPQPGLERLDQLIASARSAGARIHAELAPLDPAPSGALQLVLYRVAQESVSNALRHAPSAPIEITLRQDGTAIVLRVRNALDERAGQEHVDGHGIRGMRERVASVGGALLVGTDAEGGFTVETRIPLSLATREHV